MKHSLFFNAIVKYEVSDQVMHSPLLVSRMDVFMFGDLELSIEMIP